MAKKKHKNNKRSYVILGVLLIVVFLSVGIFSRKQSNSKYSPIDNVISPAPDKKTYHSKFLKIAVSYPSKFKMEERFGTIFLENSQGKIVVNRIATNFNSIDGYLSDIKVKNSLSIKEEGRMKINGQEAAVFTLKGYEDEDKGYFFYPAQWTIFSISTSSESLYSDLDQIARSFRYKP